MNFNIVLLYCKAQFFGIFSKLNLALLELKEPPPGVSSCFFISAKPFCLNTALFPTTQRSTKISV